MKKQKNYLTLSKKWVKSFLFDTIVLLITVFDFISMRVEIDNERTITIAHEGHKITLKRFPTKSNITMFSDLEKMLIKRGKINLPDDIIESLRDRYRFNRIFHNISIIATKQGEELVVLKNDPGKGFRVVKTPYHKTITDLLQYLVIARNSTSNNHSGIYFPVSAIKTDVPQVFTPYHPI